MSYEIPYILNPICNDKQRIKFKKAAYMSISEKRIPNYQIENQGHILSLYENSDNFPLKGTFVKKDPILKFHEEMTYLCGSVNAIITDSESKTRLVKINSKTKFKYSDSIPNKISSNNLIDMYICMECFDCDKIDYIVYRNGPGLTVQTITRNSKWWETFQPMIKSLYMNLVNETTEKTEMTTTEM
tara:strand:- start:4255 stop:4812 length:558 start_codon:yes stop_codon:yes gene_type:complete